MKDSQINLIREMMERIGGRWSLCVLYTLAISGEPLRFLAITEKIGGISDKVLTQTLRALEQDGLIIRHAFYSQVPPRVDYELTQLGRDLVLATCPLWKWMSTCIAQFENARQTFAVTKGGALMLILYNLLCDGGAVDWLCLG